MKRLKSVAIVLGGAAFCLNPLTSLFIIGTVEAMMRRRTLARWWEARAQGDAVALDAFLEPRLHPSGVRAAFARGFRAVLNTWVFTVPSCLLWLFAWYDGWNNAVHNLHTFFSFHAASHHFRREAANHCYYQIMTLSLKKQGHTTNHAFMMLIYYCTMFLF